MIFDTHAHYDDKQFDQDREELLVSMKDNGIGTIVDVGSNMETSAWIVDAVNRYPMMYGAVGVHPSDTADLTESDMDTLKEYAGKDKILAIGEIGLDYYWDEPEREIQKKWFEAQIELAREVRLPIIIHSRDAAKDTYDIMKSLHAEDIGGVVHCFSYSKEMARQFLDMGFYIGIGGVMAVAAKTKNAGKWHNHIIRRFDINPGDRLYDQGGRAHHPFAGTHHQKYYRHRSRR